MQSTKTRSLEKTRKTTLAPVRARVLATLREADAPLTRFEIASRSGLRLSSVCGRVNELIADRFVRIAGEKLDTETDRHVETLELIKPE